jgi:hypothetical protein
VRGVHSGYKRRVEDQIRSVIRDLRLSPQLNLTLRFEVPLNPVHSNRERANQIEALGMLGQHRRENTVASHVVARERQQHSFLSILSIKCRNRFYWVDRAERADGAESKESPVFMGI